MRPVKIPYQKQPRVLPAWTNDTHSALNRTRVARVIEAWTVEDVVKAVERARRYRTPLAIAGGRHAMGGQQFLNGGLLLDTRGLKRVRALDEDRGLLEVESGITWPDVIRGYLARPNGKDCLWGIRQKQTGTDRHTIGGSVAANIHGRCLTAAPFIADIESLEVVTSDAELVHCSRNERPDLFRHVVGGYGLFGVVTTATLRLVPRQQVQCRVEMLEIDGLMDKLDERISHGASYGDFQFTIDPSSTEFLRTGILSCCRPVDTERAVLPRQRRPYWSDTHQLSPHLEGYQGSFDERLVGNPRGGEMTTELCVPRSRLATFMADVRQACREHPVDIVHGTVRLIEPDRESALPCAREQYACVTFNLHVDHHPREILKAERAFVGLIDLAIAHGGTYDLAYHRFARPDQLLTCHPAVRSFIATKQRLDPEGIFQSDWYHHLLSQTSGKLC